LRAEKVSRTTPLTEGSGQRRRPRLCQEGLGLSIPCALRRAFRACLAGARRQAISKLPPWILRPRAPA